jgi:5-methylthioadenosine/S-adenosylhomocysteine deaminase
MNTCSIGVDHLIGSLEVGKAADIAVFDQEQLASAVAPDRLEVMIDALRGRDVRWLFVAGELLVRRQAKGRGSLAAIV